MGGRGSSAPSRNYLSRGAGIPTSLRGQVKRLGEIFDDLLPEQRQAIIGLNADQLAQVGVSPRVAFLIAAEALGEAEIARLIDKTLNHHPPGYTVIDRDTPRGGGTYPFLDTTGRNWHLVMREIDDQQIDNVDNPLDLLAPVSKEDSFGMAEPTLRWVKDGKVIDLYVDGMTYQQFSAATGLVVSLPKGTAVASKRISRIMRDYKLASFIPSSQTRLEILEQREDNKTIWDGAGVISRQLLRRLAIADGVTGSDLDQLMHDIRHGGRVEFTVVNSQGQYKGHAIVSDDLDVDFLLPNDVKPDVKLTNAKTFVGINFVKGHQGIELDVQSGISTYPFFSPADLRQNLEHQTEQFLNAIDTGDMGDALRTLSPNATVEDIERWATGKYYAQGGDPLWFHNPINQIINQQIERLDNNASERLRMPIEGDRFYIMPDQVGRAAGLDIQVRPGSIYIDKSTNTAWVNAQDWLHLNDSPNRSGIRDLLGGADNDDALNLHTFQREDGQIRTLVWRSPNEPGDYVLLSPTQDSVLPNPLGRNTPAGVPFGNEKLLPPRRDFQDKTYLNLVPDSDGSNLGKGQPYSIDIMSAGIRQSAINRPVLGMLINLEMLQTVLHGKTADVLPASLEQIIDTEKTGASLSAVKDWVWQQGQQILESKEPIPQSFQRRLPLKPQTDANGKRIRRPKLPSTELHWLDQTLNVVETERERITTRAELLRHEVQAPPALFDAAFANPEDIYLGAQLNQTYGAARKRYEQAYGKEEDQRKAALDAAQYAAEAFLANFPAEKQRAILRGSLVSAQMSERQAQDNAAWLQGHAGPEGRQTNSIAHRTLDALTEVGILRPLEETLQRDPDADPSYLKLATPAEQRAERRLEMLTIENVTHFELKRAGHAVPKKAPPAAIKAAQKRLQQQTEAHAYDHQLLTIRVENVNGENRAVAYSDSGTVVGVLSKQTPDILKLDGAHIRVKHALLQSHNLRVIIE